MDEIRENAEQEMVEKLKQRFPTAKVSNPFHTKYSGDRILMTINGRRIYVYFLDEVGEDGKPWFCVATDLKNLQGYSGNIEEVLDYIENNMEAVYSSRNVNIRNGRYVRAGLTREQRYNRNAERIWNDYDRRTKRFKDYLAENGVSDDEITMLHNNTGLGSNGPDLWTRTKEIADANGPDEWERLNHLK